jgi:hypothetical protein
MFHLNIQKYPKPEVLKFIDRILDEAESSLNALAEQGWKVISVQPLVRGEYGITPYRGACVAYSVTDSLLVVLEKV